jgi:putative membrane protein
MGPYNFLRTIMLFIWDLLMEWKAARYQRRHDVRPRIHRGGVYPLLRATTTVLLRELSLYVLMGDMFAGVPSVYTTFFGYDEVAHHSGVERPDAIDILYKLDEQFDRLERTAELAPRPYHIVILSDHGQSQGATFKQRYDRTLETLVRELVAEHQTVESVEPHDAGWGNVSIVFTDLLNKMVPGDNRFISRLIRRFSEGRTLVIEEFVEPTWERLEKRLEPLEPAREYLDERTSQLRQVVFGPYRQFLERTSQPLDPGTADVVVLASGNLGLIYFTNWDERMSYEQIKEAFPDLISGLAQHEGISFLQVRSEEHGPLVIGPNGVRFLEDDRVEGEDPLTDFSVNAPAHLRRTNGFPHAPDVLVNSLYDPVTEEVAAFEELVGCHGGLGGPQTAPFLLYPAAWELENDDIVGAAQLHTQLKQWLNQPCT